MKLKLFVAWLKKHHHAILWGFLISTSFVGLVLYVVGSTLADSVVVRTRLSDVPTLDISLEAFESPLSGILVDALDASRPVTAVMVENSPDARPQSGLSDAEVVFEAIAEGGITRFVAFFQVEQPEKIGPVRSVRPHYVDWVKAFDAAVAHAGGSAQGLADVRTLGAKDLDQFANAAYYYRDPDRYAPHNLYTSTELLDSLVQIKGFTESDFTGWKYRDGQPAETITADEISATISSTNYNISYVYEPSTNKYSRFVGGAKHIDANDSNQIAVDNVIIMEVPYSISGGYYLYNLVGDNIVHIINNGEVVKGSWYRSSRKGGFTFKAGGKEVILNRGHTWITAIKPGNAVTIEAAQ